MNEDAKQRIVSKKRAKAKKTNGEIDYSLISFDLTYVPEHKLDKPIRELEMSFRFQTFGELREWGQIISPNSNVHPGDRMELLLNSLLGCLVSPKAEEFEAWFCQLLEPDLKNFIKVYGEAKGEQQKK